MKDWNEVSVLLASITLVLADVPKNDWRSLLKYAPPRGWVGYPCGLLEIGQTYHLLYEYSRHSTHPVNVSWGHATSPDFIQFDDKRVVLPYNETSKEQRYSGSTVHDLNNTSGFGTANNGPVVAIYTSFYAEKSTFPDGTPVANGTQCQSIAYSIDQLKTFQTYGKNCVIKSPPSQYASEFQHFRDPKVIWYAPQKKWVMVVALSRLRKALFYSSQNMKQWTFMSEFSSVDSSDEWNKPDLFRLQVDKRNETKWIFGVNERYRGEDGYIRDGTYYYVGHFDGYNFEPDNRMAKPMVADNSTFFSAAATWPIEGSDQILLNGWVNNPSDPEAIAQQYSGAISQATKLVLRKEGNGYSLDRTEVDLSKYVKSKNDFTKAQMEDGMHANYSDHQVCILKMYFTGADKSNISLTVYNQSTVEYELQYDHENHMVYGTTYSVHGDRVSRNGTLYAGNQLPIEFRFDKEVLRISLNDGDLLLGTILIFDLDAFNGGTTMIGENVIRTVKLVKGSTATARATIQFVRRTDDETDL